METDSPPLFENTDDPIVDVRFEGETFVVAGVNEAYREVFGVSADAVTGRRVADALALAEDADRLLGQAALDGEPVETSVTRDTPEGDRHFEVRLIPHGDRTAGAYAWYIDRTEQKEYEARLKRLNESSQKLATATTETEVAEITVGIAEDILGQSLSVMWSYDRDAEALQPVAATEEAAKEGAAGDDPQEIGPIETGTREMAAFRDRELALIEEYDDLESPSHPEVGLGTLLIAPLGEYGQLHVGSRHAGGFDPATCDLIELLATHASAAIDRVKKERTLSELNDIARKQLRTTTHDAITELAAEAASDILGLSNTFVYLHDEGRDALEPVTTSVDTAVERLPTFDRDEGVLWTVFESGEPRVVTADEATGDCPSGLGLRGAVVAPLGSQGVIVGGSERTAAFDSFDRRVLSILAASTGAALDRADHDRLLHEREQALKATKDRFQSVFEHSNDAIVIFDPDADEILAANPQASDLFGYSHAELCSMGPSDIHPHDREAFRSFVEQVQTEGSGQTTRLTCNTRSGETVPAEISASTLEFDGRASVLALIRDVSERHEYERKLERQNERLERFAGVVSHDLRNPLNVALGQVELAREDTESEHLESAQGALERMEQMIEDVLTLTRVGDQDISEEPVELAGMVEGCWRNVETSAAELSGTTELSILADESRLRHVFENLFRNAVEHADTEERISIRVGTLPAEDGFFVEDSGPGIPETERERVFEQGYTTAEEGTGFGLSIVREIVRAHDWEISVTDGTEGGARFEITGVDVVDA